MQMFDWPSRDQFLSTEDDTTMRGKHTAMSRAFSDLMVANVLRIFKALYVFIDGGPSASRARGWPLCHVIRI